MPVQQIQPIFRRGRLFENTGRSSCLVLDLSVGTRLQVSLVAPRNSLSGDSAERLERGCEIWVSQYHNEQWKREEFEFLLRSDAGFPGAHEVEKPDQK